MPRARVKNVQGDSRRHGVDARARSAAVYALQRRRAYQALLDASRRARS